MKKPNFFIIGAPKCGTTSMAVYLSEHPHVFMYPEKEPHFFNTDHNNPDRAKSLTEYLVGFQECNDNHLAVGEASTNYINSSVAVHNILCDISDAKFVVMIRNPVDMARSLYDYQYFQGREHIKSFVEAWHLNEKRKSGAPVSRHCPEPRYIAYGEMCRLGVQLQRLYTVVSPDLVSVVLLDDFKENPRREYLKVLAHLGVPDDGRHDFPISNPAMTRRSHFFREVVQAAWRIKKNLGFKKSWGILGVSNRNNSIKGNRTQLQPEVSQMLFEYFLDDINLLGSLLGRDLERLWSR